MNWKKYLTLAGGAAAAVALTYILMRDDGNQENENENKKITTTNKNGCKLTKEELIELLNEIQKSQVEMKNILKKLISVAKKNNYDFMILYEIAKSMNTVDPLEKYQMEISEFDKAIESFHFDPEVKESVSKLMTSQETLCPSTNGNIITVEQLIEIHQFMLNELYKFDEDFQNIPNRSELDPKLIALVVQSIVSAKIEEKYMLSSEEVEASIAAQQYILTSNIDFARVNIQIQTVMNKFMGDHFKYMCDKNA